MTKIHIITFGCALNQADSEAMAGVLKENNYDLVNTPETADVIIINTCTVKDQTIKNFEKQLKQYKDKKIILAGCIAQTEELPYSRIGTDQIHRIPEVIEETMQGNIIALTSRERNQRINLPKIRKNKIIEIIPISQGCLGNCTYCKTREARGKLFSYDEDAIIRNAKNAIKNGVKELWITSQDTGAYGKDTNTSLPKLINKLTKIEGDFKIRIGMMNPNHAIEFIDNLLLSMESEKVFKFLHIPIQSGNNEILKLMNRHYTVEQYKEVTNKIKNKFKDLTLATDIIVGFPTESDEQFQDTIKLVKEIKFDIINRSRYSARPKTKAALMPQIHDRIKKDRSRELTEVFKTISFDNNQKWIGWEGDIIIDDSKETESMGRNFAYKPIATKKLELGTKIKIKINEAKTFRLKAFY